MGFFKDLRDDISQAVNELLPDDAFFGLDEELEEETMSKSEGNAELLVDSESVDDIGDTLAELEKMARESDEVDKNTTMDNVDLSEGVSDEEMQEDILAALAHLGDDTDSELPASMEEELPVVQETVMDELPEEEVAIEEELPVVEEPKLDELPEEEVAIEEELPVVEEPELDELPVEEVALQEELPVVEEPELDELPVEEVALQEELPVVEETVEEKVSAEEVSLENLPFDDVVIEEEENFEEEIDLSILEEIETNEENEEAVDIETVEPMVEESVEEVASEADGSDVIEETEPVMDSVEETEEEQLSMDAIGQIEENENVMDIADTAQEIEAAMDVAEDSAVTEEVKIPDDIETEYIATEEDVVDPVETEAFDGYELENLGEESILEPTEQIANSAEVSEDTSMLDDILANAEQQTDDVDTMDAEDVSAVEEVMEENITEKEVKAMENNFENAEATSEVTVITKGTVINGSITSDGGLEVNGTITGDVECLGKLTINGNVSGHLKAAEVIVSTPRLDGGIDSQGDVKVGVGTIVIGDITAKSATISGAIKGEVDVQGPVVVDSTAIVKGNITAKSVQINNGAVVDGYCKLAYAEVDIDNFFDGE